MKVRCNMCMGEFDEKDIILDEEENEHCHYCGEMGYLFDLEED